MGAYEIDISRNTLSIDGAIQVLTQKEFDLAVCMVQSPTKILCMDHLLNKFWGSNASPDTRTVDTHISRMHKKTATQWRPGLETVAGIWHWLPPGPD